MVVGEEEQSFVLSPTGCMLSSALIAPPSSSLPAQNVQSKGMGQPAPCSTQPNPHPQLEPH